MKIGVEIKVSIEVQEHRMMSWLEPTKKMQEVINKKKADIKKFREIMAAFEEAGLIGEEEVKKSSCCVIS